MGSDENNEIHSIHITRMRDGRKAQVKRKQHPTKHTLVSSLSPVPFWFADTRTRTRAQADVWLCAKGFRVVATKNTFLYIMSDLRFLVAHVEHSRTRHHQNTIKANPHRDDVRIRSGISVLHWACLFVCVCVCVCWRRANIREEDGSLQQEVLFLILVCWCACVLRIYCFLWSLIGVCVRSWLIKWGMCSKPGWQTCWA